ncbi:hypothetical protein PANO111632_02700 [Paracoccus nototheniae]|uniref:Uncharacterized protein n=1 Tax=Paracoccus nototheniae TaxID=2489002 RepID=A0ABW4DXU4_9RHOB|nr:hypothetical protein [Paracoccus nototheniae]
MMHRPVPRKMPVREMPIQRALEWAFRDECARLQFDEMGETSGAARMNVDSVWLMMQRGHVGCQVDGGGSSDPAWDAEIIASAVATIPAEHGGREMAVLVAELARAGGAPDYMKDASLGYHPGDVTQNRYGWTAKTEDSARLGSRGWPASERKGRKGRIMKEPVLYCPVYVFPTAMQISRARRQYLAWYGALLWLRAELVGLGILSRVVLTGAMPPLHPWRTE